MSKQKTLTRTELVDNFSRHLLLSQGRSALFIEAIIQQIFYALHAEDHLKISCFGTFIAHKKNERIGRNPKTGKEAAISARRSVSFRSSQILKERINKRAKQIKAQGNL